MPKYRCGTEAELGDVVSTIHCWTDPDTGQLLQAMRECVVVAFSKDFHGDDTCVQTARITAVRVHGIALISIENAFVDSEFCHLCNRGDPVPAAAATNEARNESHPV